jgi:hypothetical protein
MRTTGLVTVMVLGLGLATARADEPFPAGGIADVLKARIGKPVTLGLRSGKDVGGTVAEVRTDAVVLTRLQNRDFYDAIVRLDDVSSVELRMRER